MDKKIWEILKRSLETSTQNIVDEYVEENVKIRTKSGIESVIIRTELGRCCDWCRGLAGVYEYGDEPHDVYKRHDNCNCLVTFKSEKGYTDVWKKVEYKSQREARKTRIAEIAKGDSSYSAGYLTHLGSNGEITDPMNEDQYYRIKRALEKKGYSIDIAKGEDREFLIWANAEAMTDTIGILHLGQIPSASTFFEEIIHLRQIELYGPVDAGDYIEVAAREVAANRKILKNGEAYHFTETDYNDITKNLTYWEERFRILAGIDYDQAGIKRGI